MSCRMGPCVSIQSTTGLDREARQVRGILGHDQRTQLSCFNIPFIWKIFLYFFMPFLFLFTFTSCAATSGQSSSRRPVLVFHVGLCRACLRSGTQPRWREACCLCQWPPRGICRACYDSGKETFRDENRGGFCTAPRVQPKWPCTQFRAAQSCQILLVALRRWVLRPHVADPGWGLSPRGLHSPRPLSGTGSL